jgi:hypothetical protein
MLLFISINMGIIILLTQGGAVGMVQQEVVLQQEVVQM